MISVDQYKGKNVAILGLGRSGIAAAKSLQAAGAKVIAWDDLEPTRENAVREGLAVSPSGHMLWTGMDYLFISPGVPFHPEPNPIIKGARKARCPIISDMDMLFQHQKQAKYVGITGTNGKSTTTSLVAHILNQTGNYAVAGGNLGQAALSLEPLAEGQTYVLETSSYQLDLSNEITFDVAAMLNISADHLDRHKTMENYIAAKRKIFDRQTGTQTAVIGIDDTITRRIYEEILPREAPVIPVSVLDTLKKGIYCQNGILVDRYFKESPLEVLDLKPLPQLVGMHNWQNAAIAYSIARSCGLKTRSIAKAITSFPGLPHRQELITVHRGIRYVNDSKATNADATARALICYKHIYWILGGKAKEKNLDMLIPYLKNVKHAFCIGDAGEDFAAILKRHQVDYTLSGSLDLATQQAHDMAKQEGQDNAVVLLSPAAASFDQFKNFEDRGNVFREKVKSILMTENAAA